LGYRYFNFHLGLFGVARLVYHIVPVGSLLLDVWLSLHLSHCLTWYWFNHFYLFRYATTGNVFSLFCYDDFYADEWAFTSVDSMPEWAKWIARCNPVTYFIDVMRMVVLKGSGFADIKNQFLIMTGMAVFFNTWAILNYKKTT
jgi:ABC-2 type transport system permease protein